MTMTKQSEIRLARRNDYNEPAINPSLRVSLSSSNDDCFDRCNKGNLTLGQPNLNYIVLGEYVTLKKSELFFLLYPAA